MDLYDCSTNIKKSVSSVQEFKTESHTATVFGSRLLVNEEHVYEHNAWDHADWNSEQEEEACKQVKKQLETPMEAQAQEQLNTTASLQWDRFYMQNQNRFFRDRNWLSIEFPELFEFAAENSKRVVFEIGCGAGNTLFPLLAANSDPNLFVYAADFSAEAVQVARVEQSLLRR